MKEKSLYTLSLSCFLIGLLLIMLINEKLDISESNISSLDYRQIGERVSVKGFVYSTRSSDNLAIFTLKDKTGNITIVAFNPKDIEIKQNDILEIEGELISYKNKLEIEASRIKIF